MSLHDFHFDGDIYRQKSGGSIGLDLTGVLSDIYMCYWDIQIIQKANEAGMNVLMYKRYKDDVNVIIDTVNMNRDNVQGMKLDEAVMSELKIVADSVDPNLKVTTDYGSNHGDDRVPILDVKVWIQETSPGEWQILHTHYIKDVSSRMLMKVDSSHSMQMKINVLANEIDRIMRNCSPHIKWEDGIVPHVSYFMKRMT